MYSSIIINSFTHHSGWLPFDILNPVNKSRISSLKGMIMNNIKKTIFTAAASMFVATTVSFAAEYQLDPSHSNARFYIDHFNTTTNHGGFYGITGNVNFDPTAKTSAVEITIPVNSINTGDAGFDGHMQHEDLLNETLFPTITFQSTKWVFNDDKPTEITGDLTILGKTNPVTLTATKFNCYESPMFDNAEVCGGDFTTTIDRTLWGVDFMVEHGMTKDVVLEIQVEGVKQ